MDNYIDYIQNPPYYHKLRDFEWVDDFIKLEDIRKEIKLIQSKIDEIKSIQSPKESIITRFKESFERYEQRRIEKLSKILANSIKSIDPFSNIEHRLTRNPAMQRIGTSLTWSEIEKALGLVDFSEDTLADAEKKSRIADLNKELEDLKAKMKKHSPSGYFLLREGRIHQDARETLVNHWFSIQGKCNADCTPQGFALATGSDAEKEAYRKLGLSKAINKNANAPDPHPRS